MIDQKYVLHSTEGKSLTIKSTEKVWLVGILQVFEQGFIWFQFGVGLGILDKSKKIHFLQTKVHLLCNLLVWENWILEVHYHIQASQVKSWVHMLSDFQILRELVPRWEPPWWFLLCFDESTAPVSQWLEGKVVGSLLLPFGNHLYLNYPFIMICQLKGFHFLRIILCFTTKMQVYVTMYLNDCQRTDFYEGIGLNTKEFDMHVIIEVITWLYLTLPLPLLD